MKTLILTLMILGTCVALACAGTDPTAQSVNIFSEDALTIIVPADISYTLSTPTDSGDERASGSTTQTVNLAGNNFTNTTIQPYITVYMTGSVTNASMSLRNIMITTTGTVKAKPTTSNITLAAAPQNYAMPNADQKNTGGSVIGNHQVWITKGAGGVPAAVYPLTFIWTGYDAGV